MSVRRILIALLPVLVAVAAGASVRPAHAAPAAQPNRACPVAFAPDGVFVCVDRGDDALYLDGDPIRICVTVSLTTDFFPPPPPPLLVVTDLVNGVPRETLIQDRLTAGQRCVDRTIRAPFGQEEVTAEVFDFDGSLIVTDSVFFTSAPRPAPRPAPPPAPAPRPAPAPAPSPRPAPISPGPAPSVAPLMNFDRGSGGVYLIGESVSICWALPAPGGITLTDVDADGFETVIVDVPTDAADACTSMAVVGPAGTECVRLDWQRSRSTQTATAVDCFQVIG